MDESAHRVGVVVDPREEDALVAERNTGIGEASEGVVDFRGEFPGVVDVDAHPKRVELAKHGTKIRRDALRQKDRNA